MINYKGGPFSKAEKIKIMKWADSKSIGEIGKLLHRNPQTVQRWISTHMKNTAKGTTPDNFKAAINQDLRQKAEWSRLKLELGPKELEFFRAKYADFVWQFKEDVLPSEQLQIFNVIKNEILLSRVLQQQKKFEEDMGKLGILRDRFISSFKDNLTKMDRDDTDYLKSLDAQMASYRSSIQSLVGDYNKLQTNQHSLMKELKATRLQRFKDKEDMKISFLGIVKSLQDAENAEKEGRDMELLRMSGNKSYENLQKPHTYMDDTDDLPILTPEGWEAFNA